jgi:hypothetical protein
MKIEKFESYSNIPEKKFPTGKCIHYNSLTKVFEQNNLNEREYLNDHNKDFWSKFIHDKMYKNVVFPNTKMKDIDPKMYNMVYKEEVFLLPKSYDSSNDEEIYKKNKNYFFKRMKELMGDKYDEDILKRNINFGVKKFDWVNDFLKVAYDKYKQYYENGYLRVWMPPDVEYDNWEGYDYPHKYDIVSDLAHPNGVYYLSDIEKYIDYKYGISDDKLYEFLIKNEYIEGRYWERVWNFSYGYKDGKLDTTKLSRGRKKYGMLATENINHILNIIEKEFKDELITNSKYESGLPVYVDYYKKVNY